MRKGKGWKNQIMKWKKFTLTTTTQAVDLISSMLNDIGIQGVEIEDHVPLTEQETKGMFIDILPELPPDDGVAKVSFYVDGSEPEEEILRKVNEGPLRSRKPRTRTGLTTGNSILSLSRWTIS